MSYQVLARKWRPKSFKTMVGQESILRILTNALEQQRIHHAYLFTGTRGVGKTTLARIIAKCLNCETGITPTPCDQCSTCKAVDAGQFLDLYEIDAASRTKVEDTRELLDNVQYPPTSGRYKVYLIDEVHMLSNHSFNALLKTLEEPPAQVIFLFATTDPKKLPVTILSRCLQFHLARITPEQIAGHLEFVCREEKIEPESAALTALAKAADGSMRDALSLLDQAIAYGQGQVKKTDVDAMLGSISQDDILPLLEALAAQDSKAALAAVNMLADRAPDFEQLLEEMISVFHQIALAQIIPETALGKDIVTALMPRFTPEDVQIYYQIALLGRRDLSYSPNPQQGFEMVVLRMLAFLPAANKTVNVPPTANGVNHTAPKTNASISSTTAATAASASKPANMTTQASVANKPMTSASIAATVNTPSHLADSTIEWREVLPKLGLSGMAYALAANCILQSISETTIELAISTSHQPMLSPKLKERLTESLTRYFNRPLQINISVSTAELVTPVKQQQHEQDKRLGNAKSAALQNPAIQQLIEMYDATVDISLVN